jgi:hypothetical protein
VTGKVIKGACKADTGTFALPEPGPVTIHLGVGPGSTRYCAQCGGTAKGDPDKIFKHVDCAAPTICPTPAFPTSGD